MLRPFLHDVHPPRTDPWQLLLSGFAIAAMAFELRRMLLGGMTLPGVIVILTAASVLGRTRAPAPALALTLGVTLFVAMSDGPLFTSWVLVQIALFSFALQRPVRSVLIAAGLVAIVLYETAFLIQQRPWNDPALVGLLTWTASTAGFGVAIRSQRDYVAEVEARAAQAIQSRESEAQRRVVEERLRIARELHDAVAHHITVIGVYTGLARVKLAESAEAAAEPMAHAQNATRSVLRELQDILHLLRDPTAPGDPLDAPLPGVDELESLIGSFEDIGVPVRFRIAGERHPLSAEVDLAVYRVLQEALTNARKHGSGSDPVEAEIVFARDEVSITVTNRVAGGRHPQPDEIPSSGFGLLGMRERVRAAGGTLRASIADAIHTLHVTLPRGVPSAGEPEGFSS